MVEIIGVQFKRSKKIYYFDPGDINIKKDTKVIVETIRGTEMGYVVMANKNIKKDEVVMPLKKILRLATSKDIEQTKINEQKEKEAFSICIDKIEEHKLDMKLIDTEYTFDCNKILFYFTADGRVDFRNLVKDLAAIFKTRIELRQIGVRDEAKMLGGLGICGRPLCCSSFIGDFEPVSIKMAKEQGLSLNPNKISGTCGRLMCCLKYEQEGYEEIIRRMPKENTIVQTPSGQGIITNINLLKETVIVKLDKEDEKVLQEYKISEIEITEK